MHQDWKSIMIKLMQDIQTTVLQDNKRKFVMYVYKRNFKNMNLKDVSTYEISLPQKDFVIIYSPKHITHHSAKIRLRLRVIKWQQQFIQTELPI